MICSHGGCQTEAVVIISDLEAIHGGFDYGPGEQRAACRNHMAVICQDHPLSIVEAIAVTVKEET